MLAAYYLRFTFTIYAHIDIWNVVDFAHMHEKYAEREEYPIYAQKAFAKAYLPI